MSTLPEVRINFSWLLYYEVSAKIARLEAWDLPSVDDCEKWTNGYRESWNKDELQILTAMQDITGLEFYSPIYDISTVPGIIPKSDPLIINFMYGPERTVSTIVHELAHVILTDNNIITLKGANRDFMLANEWEKLFGFGDDFDALVHVPVHAIHKKIYLDVLNKPGLIDEDRADMDKHQATSYIKSWEYVNNHGYNEIIEKLKKSYKDIAKQLDAKK